MIAARNPLILYVPGLLPKPEPAIHRHELFRCLQEGVRRIDRGCAEALGDGAHCFDIVGWNYDFYGEHRDIALDRAAIDRLLEQRQASAADRAEADSFRRRAIRWIYRAADHLPFLIPYFADDKLEIHLRDLRRYVSNEFDIADAVRRMIQNFWSGSAEQFLAGLVDEKVLSAAELQRLAAKVKKGRDRA